MPITLSYDLRTQDANHRTYVRSMLERFGWRRLGGSVFRYDGRQTPIGTLEEDWLSDVVPSIMFFRSFLLRNNIDLVFMTLDTNSVAHIDHSDAALTFGNLPLSGNDLNLVQPTNGQSSVQRIQQFVTAAVNASAA